MEARIDDATFQAICKEKYEMVEKDNAIRDKRLDSHSDRLDRLEHTQVKTETIVQNLCNQLKGLITALWWFVGVTITTGLGFIIWYVQSIPR